MSNELVPGSNLYLEIGWVYEMPEPNPHIFEHSHDRHNEVVLHIGSDPTNPEDLGGEIEFVVGGEPLIFDKHFRTPCTSGRETWSGHLEKSQKTTYTDGDGTRCRHRS